MIRERKQIFKLSFIAFDLLLSLLAVLTSLFLHFIIIFPEKQSHVVPAEELFLVQALPLLKYPLLSTYLLLGLFYVFSQITVFIAIDIYHESHGLNRLREVIAIVRGIVANLLFVLAILFFYRGSSFSRLVILYIALFSVLYHSLGHFFFRKYLARLQILGYRVRRVLILGTGPAACRFVRALRGISIFGYTVVGMIGPARGVEDEFRHLLVGSLRDFKTIARDLNPDLIVYTLSGDWKKLSSVLEYCDSEGIDCHVIPDWMGYLTHQARTEALDGIPIFTIRDIPLKNGYNRFIKRTFDILFSLVVLILTAPVLILIALLIKIASPGPVFFVQDRVGLDRRSFHILKFRTMHLQTQQASDTTWGVKSDSRITFVGSFLRKTSLDELPQFINVLKGDMSVVGPRPERPHFVNEFKERYPQYMRRHMAKSGITGWAQIQGLRGDTSIRKRVEADIYYIENWSIWLDLIIILRTLPSVFRNPGE